LSPCCDHILEWLERHTGTWLYLALSLQPDQPPIEIGPDRTLARRGTTCVVAKIPST
jgi:hypothetical protein